MERWLALNPTCEAAPLVAAVGELDHKLDGERCWCAAFIVLVPPSSPKCIWHLATVLFLDGWNPASSCPMACGHFLHWSQWSWSQADAAINLQYFDLGQDSLSSPRPPGWYGSPNLFQISCLPRAILDLKLATYNHPGVRVVCCVISCGAAIKNAGKSLPELAIAHGTALFLHICFDDRWITKDCNHHNP